MAIKYDPNLNKEIRRVVSNFNKKVTRLEKQGKELIPDKVYVADLKAEYDKRYELKRKLKELRRFSIRGVEEVIKTEGGVRTTKYALDNLKRDIRRSKYRLTMEQKRMERKITPLDITRKGALNLVLSRKRLLSRDINLVSRSQLDTIRANIIRVLDYDKRIEKFQANFFQMLFSEAYYSDVNKEILDSIQSQLSKLSPEELLRLAKENPNIKALIDYYPNKDVDISQENMRDILEAINLQLPQYISDIKE